MNSTSKLTRAALVSAIALCFGAPVALAQSSGGSNSQQSSPQTKHGTAAATPGTEAAKGGAAMKSDAGMSTGTSGGAKGTTSSNTARGAADNTNTRARTGDGDFNTWASRHAKDHQGRISRQAYMDEMTRRWESLDRNNQGLTPAEVSRLTGKVDVDQSAPPRTGSGAQAGNMGPSSTKGN